MENRREFHRTEKAGKKETFHRVANLDIKISVKLVGMCCRLWNSIKYISWAPAALEPIQNIGILKSQRRRFKGVLWEEQFLFIVALCGS